MDIDRHAAVSRPADSVASRFEALLGRLASTFVALPAEAIDGALSEALREVVECFDFDRSTLGEFAGDPATELQATHSWARPGIPAVERQTLPKPFAELLRARRSVCFSTPEDLPPEGQRDLRGTGLRSNLTLPVEVGGEVVGALAFGTFRRDEPWPEITRERLRWVADLFGGVLARQRADAEVRRLTRRLEAENVYLREEIAGGAGAREILGQSPAIQRTLFQVAQVATTDAPVLILGETGTGKELFARAVHDQSPRRQRPLVKVNCAALPSTLIESELFGHVKGAFTGATAAKVGRFELADGGTIFLDEIGDLELALQAKLLRVLQEGEFEAVGSSQTRRVDVRILAATNRDFRQALAEGTFRSDLYYRLSVFPIELPPLRDREGDLILLVRHFIDRGNRRLGRQVRRIPSEALEQLERHPWPGNVRELQNVVDRALILSPGETLELDPTFLTVARPSAGAVPPVEAVRPPKTAEHESLAEVERRHLRKVLEARGWRINGPGNAAEVLGLHPSTLRHRLKKLGIERPAQPRT